MTWLKKIGQIILEGLQIYAGIAPAVQVALPGAAGTIQTVSNDLAQIATIIVQVEAVGQALQQPGSAKLTAAGPLVAQVILNSSVLVGKKIANPQLFQQAATDIANGMAELLNSLEATVATSSAVVPNAPPMTSAASTPTVVPPPA